MPPLKYHAGQLAIQNEAKTSHIAARLADWIGPVAEFAKDADLILLAAANADGNLGFHALSGRPPLVQAAGRTAGALRQRQAGSDEQSQLRIRFPDGLRLPLASHTAVGGLAISMAHARRARINGLLTSEGGTTELLARETFTLCRKYIVPSVAVEDTIRLGPTKREPIALTDPWLKNLLGSAETAFLASVNPEGAPDVAHRGGAPGYLALDPVARQLNWNEFVGDGVFKSAGNIRSTGRMTLLVPDPATGDGVELIGRAEYITVRTERNQRLDALVQHREKFPVQGTMRCDIQLAVRLHGLMPRRRGVDRDTITSSSSVDEQAPQ